jgi:hypothetical protein
MPKIVAFLQNQWFKDPVNVQRIIDKAIEREASGAFDHFRNRKTADEIREYFISAFLFMGCHTGKQLRRAFGEDLCNKIVWQEQSPHLGNMASATFPPDMVHIYNVLRRHQPTHVIALGKLASEALTKASVGKPWVLLTGPHPAARQKNVFQELCSLGKALTTLLERAS